MLGLPGTLGNQAVVGSHPSRVVVGNRRQVEEVVPDTRCQEEVVEEVGCLAGSWTSWAPRRLTVSEVGPDNSVRHAVKLLRSLGCGRLLRKWLPVWPRPPMGAAASRP